MGMAVRLMLQGWVVAEKRDDTGGGAWEGWH
jgi:hypothetical protein